MEFTFQYTTEEERRLIIEKNTTKYLIGVQNITEGNFLIFSDTPNMAVESELNAQREQVTVLETRNNGTMLAVAELAMATEQDKIETQLAIAELANIIAGGFE